MPFKNVQDAERRNPGIRGLKPAQKRAWVAVFNNAKSRSLDDASAAKEAWSAAGKVKIKKQEEVVMSKSTFDVHDDDIAIGIPFEKVDVKKRTISGYATLDNIDKSGEIVDFEASREAFKSWLGNIREMHGPKAVGTALSVVEKAKATEEGNYNGMWVEAYISKGAEDTWQKILDGTLKGFSIGGKVLEKRPEEHKEASAGYSRRYVNRITKYMLGELSVVDNPANPLALYDQINKADFLIKSVDGELQTTDVLKTEGKLFYCRDCDVAKVEIPGPNTSTCVQCDTPMMFIAETFDEPTEESVKAMVVENLQKALLAKDAVAYRPATGETACSNCAYFVKTEGGCTKVTGDISPNYTCDVFEASELPSAGNWVEVYNNVVQKYDTENDIEKVDIAVDVIAENDSDVNLHENGNDVNNEIKYADNQPIIDKQIDSKSQGGDFEKVDTQGLKTIRDILKSAFDSVEDVLSKAGIVNLNSENSTDVSVTDQVSLPAGVDNNATLQVPGTTGAEADLFAATPTEANVLPHMAKAEDTAVTPTKDETATDETLEKSETVEINEKASPAKETNSDTQKYIGETLEKFSSKVTEAFEAMNKNVIDMASRIENLETSGAGRKSGELNEDELSKSAKAEPFWGGMFFEKE